MNLRSQNKISPEFSMSSMTDIVFLLLIFFMLTSTMVSTNVLNLELPKADGETVQEQQPWVLSINNEGVYYLNSEPIAKEEVEAKLKSSLGTEEPAFILQAEKKVYTEDIVYVMDIANRNQFKMVLATANE